MYPAPFEYTAARSLDEAFEVLESDEEAKLLAGGHSLIPLMKLRLATPSRLVDIGGLKDLSYIRVEGGEMAIGALTRHYDLETSEILHEELPVLAAVARSIGDPSVRHRGTIGGSVAHGDGASDLPAALLALDAKFVAVGRQGERVLPAGEFFKGFLETALLPTEVLREIRVPLGAKDFGYEKFTRRAQDWAIVGVVAVRNGTPKVAYVNMAATPVRATAVEASLGRGDSVEQASSHAADNLTPPSDLHGSSEYRAHLAAVLTKRALIALGT